MNQHMVRALVLRALEMGQKDRTPSTGLIHHSDRGSQYGSEDNPRTFASMGFTISMRRFGQCYDHAVIESFLHNLKNELIHHQHLVSREQAKAKISDYSEVFYSRT